VGYQLEGQQAVTLEGARHAQGGSFFGRKAEATVVWRIANQYDCLVAVSPRGGKCVADKRCTDPAIAAIAGDSDRTEQQRPLAGATDDIPQPGCANHALAFCRNEGEVVRRELSLAQALRALALA